MWWCGLGLGLGGLGLRLAARPNESLVRNDADECLVRRAARSATARIVLADRCPDAAPRRGALADQAGGAVQEALVLTGKQVTRLVSNLGERAAQMGQRCAAEAGVALAETLGSAEWRSGTARWVSDRATEAVAEAQAALRRQQQHLLRGEPGEPPPRASPLTAHVARHVHALRAAIREHRGPGGVAPAPRTCSPL
ncbi:putative 5-dehydro-4-deoxyglucarate dehydratase, partial [Frankliniella fusca]